ncbi:hypothetical protein [Myxococcus sp. AB036A]|uniref:hypothetical protein n=1 Tax=Myxococcus sp. AB036A TaxID=2562793 RepID=UPI001E3DF81B|nr:hypothetical protein [Myxococcus sp. AB036A]
MPNKNATPPKIRIDNDVMLKQMRALLAVTTDPRDRASIQAWIERRTSELSPPEVINVAALPEHLRHLVKVPCNDPVASEETQHLVAARRNESTQQPPTLPLVADVAQSESRPSFSFSKVSYEALNARQKENYNYQKLAGVLAEYGFVTTRLSDDWNGADFLALHVGGDTLKIQLKARFTLDKKYEGKELWLAFPVDGNWYVCPYDELLDQALARTPIGDSEDWLVKGRYSSETIPTGLRSFLNNYRIS